MRSRRSRGSRRYLRATREGKAFIAVTLGVGLAAFNSGNNLMFLILGFMLSLIVLSGILSELALRQVHVSRRLPSRAHARQITLVEIVLENQKRRVPSYSLEVEDQVVGFVTERRCYFLKVAASTEQVAAYRRTPARRGHLRFSGFRIATRYPFGIFEKWRVVSSEQDMLVYPALLPAGAGVPLPEALGADVPIDRVGPGADIIGLRGYQEGDEARMIHWRRTAAFGRLLVVERQSDASTHLSVLLDNARPDDASGDWDERFEHAISTAATLAVDGIGRGFAVEVIARGTRSAVARADGTAEPVLRFLALLGSVEPSQELGFAACAPRAAAIKITPAVERSAS